MVPDPVFILIDQSVQADMIVPASDGQMELISVQDLNDAGHAPGNRVDIYWKIAGCGLDFRTQCQNNHCWFLFDWLEMDAFHSG